MSATAATTITGRPFGVALFRACRRLTVLGVASVVWFVPDGARADSYHFTWKGPDTCEVLVAPPAPQPQPCTVWKRTELGRFGDATLAASQMVTTGPDGASRGDVVVTETVGTTTRIVTQQRPAHRPDIADLSWAETDKPPVRYLDDPWTAAAAQVGEAVVLWVGGVPAPAFVKLAGRWKETRIDDLIATVRGAETGRLVGQLLSLDPAAPSITFAEFQPLNLDKAGSALRGEAVTHRLKVHPAAELEYDGRLAARPLPAGSTDEPAHTIGADGVAPCYVAAFAHDDDPAGLNIRSSPSASGRIVGRAPMLGTYGMEFSVTGAKGGWLRVEGGEYPLGTDELGPKAKPFKGTGWVNGMRLVTQAYDRELFVLPHRLSGVVARIDNKGGGPTAIDNAGAGLVQGIRGCLGRWIEMDVRMPSGAVHRGWMPRSCPSQLTTCS